MGVANDGPIASARTTMTTTTTTTTTMSVRASTIEQEAPSTFGSYFFNVFGGSESPKASSTDTAAVSASVADDGAADGVHAKLGTALRQVQDAYDASEAKTSAAQMAFETAAKELSAAHARLADAKKSGIPGVDAVAEQVLKAAKAKASDASATYMKAQEELKKAEAAKRKAEVALAESNDARVLRAKMFKTTLNAEQIELDNEARRLAAVIKLQRAFRRHLRRKHARQPRSIIRKALARVFCREGVFTMLMAFLIFSGSLFSFERAEQKPTQWTETLRTFSSLDHGYLIRGITDANVMAQLTVLRSRHDKLRISVDECESTLRAERSTGWMTSTPTCTASLREAERKVAHLTKENTVDAAVAVNTQIRVLQAELAVIRSTMQTERSKYLEQTEHLRAVHAAEGEVLLAQAQANVMDAHHEGARRLRESQFKAEDLANENAMLKERIESYEKERRGDPIGIRALTDKYDAFVKTLKDKHDANVRAIDSDYRVKLSTAKAEVVVHKSKDLASLDVLREKHAKIVSDLEEAIKLEKVRATAAENNVCSTKGSKTFAVLSYPVIIAALMMFIGVAKGSQQQTESPSQSRMAPVIGVPVCKRCDTSEIENAKLRAQVEGAERRLADVIASLDSTGKERANAQQEFDAKNSKLREVEGAFADTASLLAKRTALLEDKERELAQTKDDLAGTKNELSRTTGELARMRDELARMRNELTKRETSIQDSDKGLAGLRDDIARLKDELAQRAELLDSKDDELAKRAAMLESKDKELAELRVDLDSANTKLSNAIKKIAEKMSTLDSTGKEHMEMQNKIDALTEKLDDTTTLLEKSKALLKEKQQLIDSLLSTRTENEQKIDALEAECAELTTEQARLIEDVVNKQEEIDALMAEMEKMRIQLAALAKALEDAKAEKKLLESQLVSQEELIRLSEDKSFVIIDLETKIESLNFLVESLKAQLKSADQKHDENLLQLKNRDARVSFLEDEISSMRVMQEKAQARISEFMKRLGELEMQESRSKLAREAADTKAARLQEDFNALMARSEADIKAAAARYEEEIAHLQARLAEAQADISTLQANGDLVSSKLRQDARQLEDALEKLTLCGKEKAEKQDEIERLQRELDELRRQLAEPANQSEKTAIAPLEEQRALVYDEASVMLSKLKRISLFSLLYSVTFASVRERRQFRSLTLHSLNDIDRPAVKQVKRDSLFFAKKRAARALVQLAHAPVTHTIPSDGWSDADVAEWKHKLGWSNADEVWEWSARSLAAISRIFQGTNAYQMYQLSGLQTALELMRYAIHNREIQMHGSRAISGLISYELAYYAREAPQIVSGSALETLAQTLAHFPTDVQVVRAAARAVWVCVHLGQKFGAHTFVQQKIYEPLLIAMAYHANDLKVVESCCGAVLAAASRDPISAAKLLELGVRDEVRDTLQRVDAVNYSGAFVDLKHWLFEA